MNEQLRVTGIDFAKIATDPSMSAITQQTAIKLMKNSYMSLGDFFKGLTSSDLISLNIMAEELLTSDEALRNLLVLTLMLTAAEGLELCSDEEVHGNIGFFSTLICGEALKRKGLVNITYENLSFGADMKDKTFMELKF